MIRKNNADKNGTDNTANGTTEHENGEPKMTATASNTDPGDSYEWRKEFDFTEQEIADRGEPVGHMRFVAFQPADETKLSMMSNVKIDDDFTKAMVNHLADNDETFAYFKKLISMATMYRDLANGDIGSVLERVFGGGRSGRSPFQSGGRSFGSVDEVEELIGRIGRRKPRNPLESLLERLGERGDRAKIGIEAHVIGIKKREGQSVEDAIREAMANDTDGDDAGFISGLADLLRNITGGENCDCPRCTAMRERKKRESESGTETPGE